MWGWIVSAVMGLATTGIVWYFKSRLSQAASVADLVSLNTKVLTDLNSLLASLTARANAAGTKDKIDAKAVKDAAGAATFLNDSTGDNLMRPDSSARGTVPSVRLTDSSRGTCVVVGFARGPGNYIPGAGVGFSTVD